MAPKHASPVPKDKFRIRSDKNQLCASGLAAGSVLQERVPNQFKRNMAHTVNFIQKRYFIVSSTGLTISDLRFNGLRAYVYATG